MEVADTVVYSVHYFSNVQCILHIQLIVLWNKMSAWFNSNLTVKFSNMAYFEACEELKQFAKCVTINVITLHLWWNPPQWQPHFKFVVKTWCKTKTQNQAWVIVCHSYSCLDFATTRFEILWVELVRNRDWYTGIRELNAIVISRFTTCMKCDFREWWFSCICNVVCENLASFSMIFVI